MLGRCERPASIERETAVRDDEDEQPAAAKDATPLEQRTDRIVEVLDDVAADDEVDEGCQSPRGRGCRRSRRGRRSRPDRPPSSGVGVLLDPELVDVADVRSRRQEGRTAERSIEPIAPQFFVERLPNRRCQTRSSCVGFGVAVTAVGVCGISHVCWAERNTRYLLRTSTAPKASEEAIASIQHLRLLAQLLHRAPQQLEAARLQGIRVAVVDSSSSKRYEKLTSFAREGANNREVNHV